MTRHEPSHQDWFLFFMRAPPKLGMVVCTFNSSAGRADKLIPEARLPASLAYVVNYKLVRDPVPKHKVNSVLGATPEAVLWLPHACVHTSSQTHTRIH